MKWLGHNDARDTGCNKWPLFVFCLSFVLWLLCFLRLFVVLAVNVCLLYCVCVCSVLFCSRSGTESSSFKGLELHHGSEI